MRFTNPLFVLIAGVAVVAAAPPNFDDDILPIFEQSCNNCHNPDKTKGDLDLSTFSAAMRGGSGGPLGDPGDGVSSRLYGVVSHTMEPRMPENGDKLEKKQADLIRAWVDAGFLENKTGKPKKKKKPAFTLKAAAGVGKPDGPPPMPQHLLREPVVTTSRSSAVLDMAPSPWAPLIAIAGQRQVLLYHTDTLQLEAVLPFAHGQPEVLSFHPSGKYLLAGGGVGGKMGTTVTWEVESGKSVIRAGKDFDSVLAASLRSDLGGVSLGGPGKRVKLWDTQSDEQLVSIKKHTDWVTHLGYSPDGVLLASGGRGGGVYVWEAETGNEFHNLRAHQGAITGLVWRFDSNLLASASEDGNVIVWEMNHGKQAKKWAAHGGGVLSVDWTRDGHLVTSGRDKKVKIWKPDFGFLKELPVFSSMVVKVVFSHDGKRLICADWSGSITVWDVASAKQVGSLAANPPTVAGQIDMVQKELDALPVKISESQKSWNESAAKLKNSQQALAKKELEQKQAVAKQKQLTAERGKLDARLKGMREESGRLRDERGQKQQSLTDAREKLKQHNAAVSAARDVLKGVDDTLNHLKSMEAGLVQGEQNARKHAEENAEDTSAQQSATKASEQLAQHRIQVAEKESLRTREQTALAQLTEQRKGPGNQLAAAEQASKEVDKRWQDHHAKLKPVEQRRHAIDKPLSDVGKRLGVLESQVKQAREGVGNSERAHQKALAHKEHLGKQEPILKKRLQQWRAAAINTEAIHLQAEALKMSDQQEQLIQDFTSLADEIAQLKDPSKLPEKSRKLVRMKRQIDQAAQGVLDKRHDAVKRKEAYLKVVP